MAEDMAITGGVGGANEPGVDRTPPVFVAGVLTWNDAGRCLQTVRALQVNARGLSRIVVLDNGSDPADADHVAEKLAQPPPATSPGLLPLPPVTLHRLSVNDGCHAGTTALASFILADPTITHVLWVQDDWICDEPFDLTDYAALATDPTNGQIRLARREIRPPVKYFTYAVPAAGAALAATSIDLPLIPHTADQAVQYLQRIWWTHHPSLLRRALVEQFLLQNETETAIGRRYYLSGLTTIAAVPGLFIHDRAPHNARQIAGWRH